MKYQSFGNLIWSSLLRSWGPVLVFVGLAIAFIPLFVVPETTTIKLAWFIFIISIAFLLIVLFARAAWEANEKQTIDLPKIILVKEPPKAYANASALFLLEPTPLLSFDAIVSIYYLDDEVERLVAVGKVINVQNDKKIQVIIFDDHDFGDKYEPVKRNSKDELKKLLVRSSVPGSWMENIING